MNTAAFKENKTRIFTDKDREDYNHHNLTKFCFNHNIPEIDPDVYVHFKAVDDAAKKTYTPK